VSLYQCLWLCLVFALITVAADIRPVWFGIPTAILTVTGLRLYAAKVHQ
jgi:hypothetical protein